MEVRDLDVNEFKALVQEAVEEKLEEMLGDPDQGLELRESVRERLKRSLAATARGEQGIAVDEEAKDITVHLVGHRRDIYKKK